MTKEQPQSNKNKEPVTKSQENVRTQVIRESRSADKHSGAATDGSRQTVQRKSQTKTVQKKTTNQSSMKKVKAFCCVWWDFHGDYLSAPVFVYRDRR